jgi:hypothetical protein
MSGCLNPVQFGPPFWATIHLTAYHQTDPKKFNDFINIITDILPCENCQGEFQKLLKTYPPDSEPNGYFEWSVNVHNKINERLHKPVISMEQARTMWCTNKTSHYGTPSSPMNLWIVLLVILGILYFLRVLR